MAGGSGTPDLWTLRRADTILQEYVRRGIVLESADDLGVTRRLFDSCTKLLLAAQGNNEHFHEAQKLLDRSRVQRPEQLKLDAPLDTAERAVLPANVVPMPKGRPSGWGTT
jgi:hypothetical protein